MHDLLRLLLQGDAEVGNTVHRFPGVLLQQSPQHEYLGALWVVHAHLSTSSGDHLMGNDHSLVLPIAPRTVPRRQLNFESEAPAFTASSNNSFAYDPQQGTAASSSSPLPPPPPPPQSASESTSMTDVFLVWASLQYLQRHLPLVYASVEAECRERHDATARGSPLQQFASYLAMPSDGSRFSYHEDDAAEAAICIRAADVLSVCAELHHLTVRDRRVQAITVCTRQYSRDAFRLAFSDTPLARRSGGEGSGSGGRTVQDYRLVFRLGGSMRFVSVLKSAVPSVELHGELAAADGGGSSGASARGDPPSTRTTIFSPSNGDAMGGGNGGAPSNSLSNFLRPFWRRGGMPRPTTGNSTVNPNSGNAAEQQDENFASSSYRPKSDSSDSSSFQDLAADYAPPVPILTLPAAGLHQQPVEPLSATSWRACFVGPEKVRDASLFAEARQTVFSGGVEPAIRAEVWLHLLDVFPCGATQKQRDAVMSDHKRVYQALRTQWDSILPEQEAHWAKFGQHKRSIDGDVARTDRTLAAYRDDNSPRLLTVRRVLQAHVLYNFDLGYSQGMSDVAAVIALLVDPPTEGDAEIEVFVAFRAMLASRMRANFSMNVLTGIPQLMRYVQVLVRHFAPHLYAHLQRLQSETMTFTFRWLLTCFKREFVMADTMRLWDTLLACPFTEHYDVIVVVSLLIAVGPQIISSLHSCDEVLKFANNLSQGQVSAATLLSCASGFYDVMCAEAARMEGAMRGGYVPVSQPSVEDVVRLCLHVDGSL